MNNFFKRLAEACKVIFPPSEKKVQAKAEKAAMKAFMDSTLLDEITGFYVN